MRTSVATVALIAVLFGGCDGGGEETLPEAVSLDNVLDTVRSQFATYVYLYHIAPEGADTAKMKEAIRLGIESIWVLEAALIEDILKERYPEAAITSFDFNMDMTVEASVSSINPTKGEKWNERDRQE